MNFDDLFPSKYLKASDFPHPRILTMRAVRLEEVGEEKKVKPCVYFNEESKALCLNKTNGSVVANAYGKTVDTWSGRQIELFATQVPMQGRVVDAIRVRVPAPAAAPAPVAAAPTAPAPEAQPAQEPFFNDDVDF